MTRVSHLVSAMQRFRSIAERAAAPIGLVVEEGDANG
jgi:hypothetical protein